MRLFDNVWRPRRARPDELGGASVSSFGKAVKQFFHDARPSVATAGAPVLPVGVLFMMNAADELDRVAFSVLLPEIRDYYGVSLTSVLTVVSVSGILVLLLAVPVGYAADRWNRTRLLAAGATTWGIFSILTAFARSLFMLGAFRFGSGMGKTLDPAQQSLLADYYPPHARGGVFSFHRLGNSVGQMVGPLLAGWLATLFFWQAPFLVFGVLGFIVAALALFKLREPVRGVHEQALIGVEAAPEKPPSWTEAWRIARSVRTLRRIWYALPFLVGAGLGTLSLLGVYLEDQFDLSAGARGTLMAMNEPFQIVGLIFGGTMTNRFLAKGRPGRLVSYGGLMAALGALTFVVIALVPLLPVAFILMCAYAFTAAIFVPAVTVLMTIVIPPKARGFALGLGAVFIVPGALLIPIAGMIGDTYGPRMGVLMLAPIYLIGAALLVAAGSTVEGDMRASWAASAAMTAATSTDALLVVRDLDVHYGQVQILFGVDLTVAEGEIVALLGTNGAGKSTLLNAIGGLAPITGGAINFAGEDITHLPASEHPARGIIPVPGGKGVFPSLSVGENLRLATWTFADDEERIRAGMEEVFAFFPRLRERIDEAAGSLSGGEQQMLTLGQAFLSRPKLLMIDELSLGLAPAVVEQLLEIVRAIHAQGTTIILVEQSVNVALTVAERAVFMEKGEVRFTGPTADLVGRGDLLRSVFIGASGPEDARTSPVRADAPVVLSARGLTKRFGGLTAVDGVDLDVRAGEIVGVIGPNGAGKTTLLDLLAGAAKPDAGSVAIGDEDVTDLHAAERAERGMARTFQDARLFPGLTVEESLAVALERFLVSRDVVAAALRLPASVLSEALAARQVDALVDALGLGAFGGKLASELSTGSRRVVELGSLVAQQGEVLLLDEPGAGLAQRETEAMAPLLRRLRDATGAALVVVEHDVPMLLAACDRLVAMELGRVIADGAPADVVTDERVITSYLGTSDTAVARSGTTGGGRRRRAPRRRQPSGARTGRSTASK